MRIRFVRGPDGKVIGAEVESGGKRIRAARRQ
jgi:hypothetical protein